jgi:hypothetical protein
MNTREHDDKEYKEPKPEKSEWDEWREDDNARRYREWESDNRRPY